MDDLLHAALIALADAEGREALGRWLAERPPGDDPDTLVLDLLRTDLLPVARRRAALLLRGKPSVTTADEVVQHVVPRGASGAGSYALLAEIGRGAMGTVHVARDLELRRKVAYKRLEAGAGPSSRARFVAEAQITAQLDHPNIVPIYQLRCEAGAPPAYAMKLVDGRMLFDIWTEAAGRHEAGEVIDEAAERTHRLDLFLGICDGVAYAHSRGVVHCDLKPSNVMIGAWGEVQVMDWGIARRVDDGPVALVRGTPAYMAPEQAAGGPPIPASDQYALGMILQELVTLRRARVIPKGARPMPAAFRGEREPVVHLNPHEAIPPGLSAVIACATTRDPSGRYPDVMALAADVRRFLHGDAVSVLRDNAPQRAARAVRRRPEAAIAGFLGVVLILVVVAGLAVVVALARAVAVEQGALAGTAHLATIERRASVVEAEVLRFGRLLEGVSAATTVVLSQTEPREVPLWIASDPSTTPPLRELAIDGVQATLTRPAFWAPASHVDPTPTFARLAKLDTTLRRALLRSSRSGLVSTDIEEAWRRVAAGDNGVRRFRVVLRDGVEFVFPGQVDVDADRRRATWYQAAIDQPFPQWSPPYLDGEGRASMTCSRSIYGEGDQGFLGVAAAEIALDRALADLLANDDGNLAEQWMVDAEGRVLASSAGPGDLAVIVEPGVRAALTQRLGTWFRDDDGSIVAVAPLPVLGWTLVGRFVGP